MTEPQAAAEQPAAVAPDVPPPNLGKRAVGLWRLIVAVFLGYRGEALALRAGNLTFITITSLVPVAAVIFSLLHAFKASRIDPLVLHFFEDILSPGGREQSAQTIRTFLSTANSRAAGSLSFLVLLVSAGLMLRHLDASLNDIWRVRQKRPIFTSILLYAGVLLFGPLLIAVSLLGTDSVKRFLGWLEFPFSAQVYLLGAALAAVTLFSVLYKFAPHAPVRWRSAFTGGAVAGIVWEAARHLYGGIASLFFSANKVYGSLGIAPLFLMWIYIGWYIVLSGARLAYAIEHVDFHDEFRDLLEHPRSNELIATGIAELVARAAVAATPPPTTKTIAASLHIPEQRVIELAAVLLRGGLLLSNEKGALLPARELELLTLADISAAVGGTARIVNRERSASTGQFSGVARFFVAADEVTVDKLRAISWRDLAQPPSIAEKA